MARFDVMKAFAFLTPCRWERRGIMLHRSRTQVKRTRMSL